MSAALPTDPLLVNPYATYDSRAIQDVSPSSSTEFASNPQGEEMSQADGAIGREGSHLKLFYSLLLDSIPVMLSYALQNSIQAVSVLIVGRLGSEQLSVAAFSLMLAFVTG